MSFKKIVLLGLLATVVVPQQSSAASSPNNAASQDTACFTRLKNFFFYNSETLTPWQRAELENLLSTGSSWKNRELDSADVFDAMLKTLIPWLILVDHSRTR